VEIAGKTGQIYFQELPDCVVVGSARGQKPSGGYRLAADRHVCLIVSKMDAAHPKKVPTRRMGTRENHLLILNEIRISGFRAHLEICLDSHTTDRNKSKNEDSCSL
jgi:hypothetical protein